MSSLPVDPHQVVVCDLPRCEGLMRRRQAVPVSVVVDGYRLRGLTCSLEHAAELRRGWRTRDAYGADLGPTPVSELVKTG